MPVENGSVADTSGPPTKRQREDEVPVAVPMVLPLPQWTVPASKESHDCVNVVRGCAEQYFNAELARVDKTRLINSSIGDPAYHGVLNPDPAAVEAVKRAVESGKYHGYGHSSGLEIARKAVAEVYHREDPSLTHERVVMTCSCSGAIEMSLAVLANPGQNVLCPTPGFGLYKCHLASKGVETRFYKLLPERSWEVDLKDLNEKINDKTAAIVVCNPSNPCGSVYSAQHLTDIIALAEKHRLPIIADETYAWMVFKGQQYCSMASLSENVPILSCGTVSKRFLVPGWRLGWILIHDRNNAFERGKVIEGLTERLPMKLLGPCTLIQAALPDIFKNVPQSFYDGTMATVEANARCCMEGLQGVPGLKPVMPAGATYMMVVIELEHFPEFEDDIGFTKQLLVEQSVFCLPGMAFFAKACFRIVLMMSIDKSRQLCERVQEFCQNHYRA